MFNTILMDAELTLTEIGICTAAALISGIIIALSYRVTAHPSKSFAITTAVLPVMVMVVILMVNGNLGVGVAVAGSFSLVRFRSLPGRASDIGAVFLAMAAGLACGTGYVTFAVGMTILICVVTYLLYRSGLFSQPETLRYLTITIPEDLDYADVFADIFKTYTDQASLSSMKTVNLGALYELRYEMTLKDPAKEKELLDAIRVRNGNLTVQSSRMAPAASEL